MMRLHFSKAKVFIYIMWWIVFQLLQECFLFPNPCFQLLLCWTCLDRCPIFCCNSLYFPSHSIFFLSSVNSPPFLPSIIIMEWSSSPVFNPSKIHWSSIYFLPLCENFLCLTQDGALHVLYFSIVDDFA